MQSRPCSCQVHSVQDVAYDGDPIIVTELCWFSVNGTDRLAL